MKGYLSSRKQLVREGKWDSENWLDVPKLERRRRAVWAMVVQVKIIPDTVAQDPPTADLRIHDSCRPADIYLYDARMPAEMTEGGAEVILGFPAIVVGVGFAHAVTDGQGIKLYGESGGM